MNQVAFKASETVAIVGIQQDCECSHCGRPLKVGVRLANFGGAFGADCLAKAAAPYTYNGRAYSEKADSLKERAIIKHKGTDCISRHGMNENHFRLTLKTDLKSI